MFNDLTTVTQGSFGLTSAIYNLTKLGYIVSIPIIDNQSYDLIADKDGTLNKVEVKTTGSKAPSGNYTVQIKSVRSNKTVNTIKNFDKSLVDILYILTAENTNYIIPTQELEATCSITLGAKYDKYKIKEGAGKVSNRT